MGMPCIRPSVSMCVQRKAPHQHSKAAIISSGVTLASSRQPRIATRPTLQPQCPACQVRWRAEDEVAASIINRTRESVELDKLGLQMLVGHRSVNAVFTVRDIL